MAKGRQAGLSLTYKLPLLMTGLLAVTTVVTVALAYEEVQRAAVDSARDRVHSVAQELAALAAPSIPRRMQAMQEVARDPAVLSYLSSPGSGGEDEARAALSKLRVQTDSIQWVFLLDAGQQPLLEVHGPAVADAPVPTRLPASGFGPFRQVGGRAEYWVVQPVVRGRTEIGEVAELRRLGPSAGAEGLRSLIGRDFSVYFSNAGGTPWITLEGEVVTAGEAVRVSGAATYHSGGEEHFAHSVAIQGTPWAIVATVPLREVLARPHAFLRHSALAALLVMLVGTGGAWLVSRRITRPMKVLRRASEAIAHGDYDQRIALQRSDELGVLAEGFNEMAARVQGTHDQLRQQYETAQALADELDRASRAKSEFLATISHEIRTPINAILGYADLLLLGVQGPVNDVQAGQLERILLSGRHLVSLVDQVLDLSRIESGRLQVDEEIAAVEASVETTVTLSRPQAEAKGVGLAWDASPGAAHWYTGDPQRVNQVLVNLVANAIKFTEVGGRVVVRCEERFGTLPESGEEGAWTCVVVQDTGVGISADKQASIFEPFVQVESGYTRRHGGAGLGLAISLRLARSMGGDLTVESTPGEGSRFTLWLPAASAPEPVEV